MPDSPMCLSDDKCQFASKCYRSITSGTIPDKHFQTWVSPQPPREGEKCPHFLERSE
jgi:hypothetical protein